MATIAIENPLPVNSGESNSTRKKKAKAGDGTPTTLTATEQPAPESPNHDGDANGVYEHPHLKELQKQIRGVNKKLGSMQKTDAVIAENPGVSLDELVAQRKINNDQKASAEKKPGLQAQVQQLEEQVQVFRNVNAEYQAQMQKQKDDIAAQHRKELEKMKEDTRLDGVTSSASELRTKLLVFSQFLRAAAAKRNVDEDAGSDENMAFEGALLLVYGGDEKAVDTAVSLIEGSDEQVPSIDGQPLPVKYSQIKQASIDHAPLPSEEAWADQVEETNTAVGEQLAPADPLISGSDPTQAHAGLTELDAPAQTNGAPAETAHESITSPVQASAGDDAGNIAGDRWDTGAGAAGTDEMEESYEIVPRPNDEVDTPVPSNAPAAEQSQKTNMADEGPAYDQSSGNQAGEAWDTKAAGDQGADNSWATEVTAAAESGGQVANPTSAVDGPETAQPDDGFQAVGGGRRGRGGPRGRGDGEFRGRGRGGRGGGFRGDGEFRGRGGRGRGGRGDGEFRGRGRGGRGRGGEGASRGGSS